MLIDQIKSDQLTARKAKDSVRASLLTTLYSEAAMVGKNDGNRQSTDLEVITTIKKFLNGIEETLKVRNDANLITEKEILLAYLPKQLSVDELGNIIDTIISSNNITSMKQMGLVMKELNAKHAGLFDGSVASGLVRAKLSSI